MKYIAIAWFVLSLIALIDLWLAPEMDDNGFYIKTKEVNRKQARCGMDSQTRDTSTTKHT